MKVFILGHRGMLGHVVVRYLREQSVEVLTTDSRYSGGPGDPLATEVRESSADWIINCIGKIKQKSQDQLDLLLGNAILPLHLRTLLLPNQRLIHASTDCVFSGRRGNYRVDENRDAEDHYGFSKIIGEAVGDHPRCLVLRTSIIGPELSSGSGLMGWFLNQKGEVRGFTNHYWNGITTLEWARVALELMKGEISRRTGILQVGSAKPVSKCDLLKIIASIWPHLIEIAPIEAADRIDRTLAPELVRPELHEQIRQLRDWYKKTRRQGT